MVVGAVPVVHPNASCRPIVGKFDDTCAFEIFEFPEGGKKRGPSDGVECVGCPVGMLFDDMFAKVLFAMVALKEAAGVPSNGDSVVI